eukprot:39672_1
MAMSERKQTISTKCNGEGKLIECESTNRIKLILEKYNHILYDNHSNSEYQLQNEVTQLMHNILVNGQYSNVEIINDFYHIKYDHDVNDNLQQFDLFYQYLNNYDNVLICDVNNCETVNRYYNIRRSCRSLNTPRDDIKTNDIHSSIINSLNLISQIHTYFIHAYDIDQLSSDEIKYIEKHLNTLEYKDDMHQNDRKLQLIVSVINKKKEKVLAITDHQIDNSKYVTSEMYCMNYQTLDFENISFGGYYTEQRVEETKFRKAVIAHGYHKQQLIDELVDIIFQETDRNTSISIILKKTAPRFKDCYKRQQIYNQLIHKYIKLAELDNRNFTQILKITAAKIIPTINVDEIEKIAINKNLNGKIFLKSSSNFTNSIQFAKIFQSIQNWNKKQWAKIYVQIKQWTPE